MKRMWSVLCAAIMLLAMLPSVAAFAATSGNYVYTVLADNTVQITAYNGSASDVDIPAVLNGYTVTQIGEGVFQNDTGLRTVSFPDSVTDILKDVFNGCTNLRSISLPDGLITIGDSAFMSCISLRRISIPDGVTTIGHGAFYDCTALESLVLPSGLQFLGAFAFYETALSSVTIPQGVTSIGDCAFYGCEELQSVTIPQGLTSIGDYAFGDCSALQGVTIPFGVTSIGNYAFSHCNALQSIIVPDSVTSMGRYVFEACTSLQSAVLSKNVSGVPNGTFKSNISLQDVTLPDHGGIGSEAFWRCGMLKNVIVPNDAVAIGSYAFYQCGALESISIPGTVTEIDAYAFGDCDALRKVYYGGDYYQYESKLKIGSFNDDFKKANWYMNARYGVRVGDVFCVVRTDDTVRISGWYGNSNGQIRIPDTVDGYPVTAVSDLSYTHIECLFLPKTVTTIEERAFEEASRLKRVYYGGTEQDRQAMSIGAYNARFEDAIWYYDAIDGGTYNNFVYAVYSDNTAAVVDYTSNVWNERLPSSVNGYPLTRIADNAYKNCTGLRSIIVSDSVTSIGESAFDGCKSLQSVTLPRTLSDIQYRTFADCTALQSIVLPQGVMAIEEEAFDGCTALATVALPASVQKVDAWAFADCDSLQTVYYGGTEADRAAMSVKEGNDRLQNAVWKYGCVLSTKTFPDVKEGDWYYEAVNYVSANGCMTGFANGNFGPAADMQRQDFVLTLARINGVDLDKYAGQNGGMKDVPKNAYYAAAVAWCVDKGIIMGYQNGKFGVGDPITREQVCTIFYRYMISPTVTDVDGILSRFPDRAAISPFARTAVAWAVQNGVMSGMGSGKMAPVVKASRAQVATIVMRMDQKGML